MTTRPLSETTAPPVTVIGLGPMGRALAGAFLDGGHPVTVWNRTAAKADALVARGAVRADTVAEAIAAGPVTMTCLLTYDTAHEVLDLDAGYLAERTLVNLTNGTPAQAREMAEWAAGHGADYLDGGIMAVPSMIGRPEASVFYSGSDRAFNAHEAALAALGGTRYLGTDAGRAALYDLALLSAMYGMFGGYFHAAALLDAEKVPAAEFTPLVVRWLTAMLASLPGMAMALDSGLDPGGGSTLGMQAAGYGNLIAASRALGVSTELIEPMQALLRRGAATGPDKGTAALIPLLRTR